MPRLVKKYEGLPGARQAYADAKAWGDMDDAVTVRDFVLELKRLGLVVDDKIKESDPRGR